MAGYFRGWVDDVIQYVYTTLNSIPGVLLIAAAVLMMQVYIDRIPSCSRPCSERADLRLLFLCVILGLTSWTGLCRLLRGEALKLRELEYIQAAQAFGVRDPRIIARHILPNVMHIVLIAVVMDFSGLVLAEAVLSYVGVGVDPSMISFGTMINAARLEMAREPMVWWSLAAAFVFMFVLVLAANLFADAVRDAFDPRVRAGGGSRLHCLAARSRAAPADSRMNANALLDVKDLSTWLDTATRASCARSTASRFDIRRGETFALLGESGCGKSMTALSLMRLLPDAGRDRRRRSAARTGPNLSRCRKPRCATCAAGAWR